MKKTLAALAVLGAFAGSSMAADVQLYGVVDTGFAYYNVKNTGSQSENSFEMQSGWDTASRFGLKGSEDLGNGYTVSFKLENGFDSDSGTFSQEDRLFGREAGVTVSGPYGSIAFGRFGGISSSCGTYDLLSYVESFDGGDGEVWGFAASDRYDNMVVYQSPRFAGLQLTAQYSFKTDSNATADDYNGSEGTSHAERYASIGLSGEYGPAGFAIGYELTKYGSNDDGYRKLVDDDGHLVFIGGNYDLEVVQLFAEAQYFKGQTAAAGFDMGDKIKFKIGNTTLERNLLGIDGVEGLKGYGLHVGAAAPIGAGTLTAGVYYVDSELELGSASELQNPDITYWGLSARYNYPLSERTGVYFGAGYGESKIDGKDSFRFVNGTEKEYKTQTTQVYCGLVHTF